MKDSAQGRHLPQDNAIDVERLVKRFGDYTAVDGLTGQQVLDALAGMRGTRYAAAERKLVADFAMDTRKVVRTYAKGNRQKVVLVAAFAARTELLVLDEPTSGLDPLMEGLFQRCVREAAAEGRTVLLSSHILAEVEQLCESVTIIKDGRLVESGRLADMRHLAASEVTASLSSNTSPVATCCTSRTLSAAPPVASGPIGPTVGIHAWHGTPARPRSRRALRVVGCRERSVGWRQISARRDRLWQHLRGVTSDPDRFDSPRRRRDLPR